VNVLIIGGTGLISTPLAQRLLERGFEVTLFNRGQRATAPPGSSVIVGDRNDHAAFERQMAEATRFDCVIDMICYSPADAHSLVRAFEGRVGQLIVCSTVDVYEKPPTAYPITEDTPQRPAPFGYAQDKARCETILWEADARGGLPITVVRPAHTYSDRGSLFSSLSHQGVYLDRLRRGLPIVVHGDGSSLWSACRAEDVAEAFVRAVGNTVTFGRSYNVTAEEWLTWDQMHTIVAEALGAPTPSLVHIPTESLARLAPERALLCNVNYRYNNVFDTSRARADLGFTQTIPFARGARRTVAWLEANGLLESHSEDSFEDSFEDRLVEIWGRAEASPAQNFIPERTG
jgi:nucleoside-diphosphate-sugar epimerase